MMLKNKLLGYLLQVLMEKIYKKKFQKQFALGILDKHFLKYQMIVKFLKEIQMVQLEFQLWIN